MGKSIVISEDIFWISVVRSGGGLAKLEGFEDDKDDKDDKDEDDKDEDDKDEDDKDEDEGGVGGSRDGGAIKWDGGEIIEGGGQGAGRDGKGRTI